MGNGEIESDDATLILDMSTGKATAHADALHAGDMNGNGKLDAADSSQILYYVANNSWSSLPNPHPGSATYSLEKQTVQLQLSNVTLRPDQTGKMRLDGIGLQNISSSDFMLIYDQRK